MTVNMKSLTFSLIEQNNEKKWIHTSDKYISKRDCQREHARIKTGGGQNARK